MKSLLALIILLLIGESPLFAGGFQLNEHGARAVGQAGAWVARAYDLSAVYFNPAGLGFQSGTSFSIGTTLIAPSATYFGLGTGPTDMVDQLFTPVNAYARTSITDEITAGFGIYNPFGLGTEWPSEWSGRYVTTKADLVSFCFSPTIAFRLHKTVSIGVGINFATGAARLSRVVSDPFFQQEHDATIEAEGTGWGFNVGVLYRITEDLSAGLSYRSSIKVEATGTASFSPTRSYLPSGAASTSLELPSTGYFGLSYRIMKDLDLEADFQYVGWSSYNELAVTFAADGSSSVEPKKYEDTFILRLGGEYTAGDVQLRAGYFFDNNPIPETYVEPTLPDVDRHGLNVGAGYAVSGSMNVDVYVMLLRGVQRKVSNTYVGFDGTYRTSATLFGVNVSYTIGGM